MRQRRATPVQQRVADAGIEVKFLAVGWLLDRDEGADPGAVVPGVGQGGQVSCGGPVRGGQGMGAGWRAARSGRPAGGPVAVAGCRPPSLGLLLAGLFWLAFGWTLALAWGKLSVWGRL